MLLVLPTPLTTLAGVLVALLGAVAEVVEVARVSVALTSEAEELLALFLCLLLLSLLLLEERWFSSLLLLPRPALLLSLAFSGSSSSEKDSKFSSKA